MIDVSRVNLQNVSLRYTPADIRTGYVMSWHFTIQREIAGTCCSTSPTSATARTSW
jgi:hypothetical protein